MAKPRMIKMLNWIYWLERIIRFLARVPPRNKLWTTPISLGPMGYRVACRPRPRSLASIRDILYSTIPFFIPDHVEIKFSNALKISFYSKWNIKILKIFKILKSVCLFTCQKRIGRHQPYQQVDLTFGQIHLQLLRNWQELGACLSLEVQSDQQKLL